MRIGGLVGWAMLCCTLLFAGCGAGSGRSGTDLAVNGVGPSAPVNGGDAAVYVMTVANVGSYTADNVVIRNSTQQLTQSGLTIVCTAAGGANCPAQTGPAMTVSALPPGGTLRFQVTGTAVAGASGTIGYTMTVTADTADTNTDNNSITITSPVGSNDVSVTATAPAGPLVDGPAVFTMVVSNVGPNDALNVSLATSVSADLTLVPGAISCVPSGGAVAPALQGDGTLLSPLLPVNGVLTCSVPVTVSVATNGFAIVTMTATTVGDSRSSNNSGTASASATLVGDLGVTATAPPGPLTSGSATFTMVVANAGPSTATDVVIANSVSPNLTLSAAITCVPAGGATTPTLQSDGTLLVASVPANATLTCSVPVTVAAGTTGSVYDTMTVSTVGDPRPGNNSATALVSATLGNNVSVTGSAAAASVIGGQATSFNMVVGNSGPSTAFDVALTNVLGPNLGLAGSITCVAGGGAATPLVTGGGLSSAAIPVGGSLACNIPVTVTAGANGTVFTTFTATAANDQRGGDNSATASTVAVSSDLGVSQTGDIQISAGTATTFKALISNPGPGTASNVRITWSHTSASGLSFDLPVCTATGGATCPTIGAGSTSWTVPSLGIGRTLSFAFTANAGAGFRGSIGNTVTVVSDEDQNTGNNTATTTTSVIDARNGSYKAFAADGRQYDLTIDFDAGSYTMIGAASVSRSFTADASGGGFTVAGNARFRVATDMIVGGHDFGAGVLPFVAVRSFGTALTEVVGQYNLVTRDVPASGQAVTHAAVMVVSGNQMYICQTDNGSIRPPNNCIAGQQKNYVLTVVNGVYTATEVTGSDSFTFYVARSDASKMLFGALPVGSATGQLRIALQDAPVLLGGTLSGPSTSGFWVDPMVLTGSMYSATGGVADTASATIGVIVNSGVGSMLAGFRNTDGQRFWVMQASPLAIAFGDFTAVTPEAAGLMQIVLP